MKSSQVSWLAIAAISILGMGSLIQKAEALIPQSSDIFDQSPNKSLHAQNVEPKSGDGDGEVDDDDEQKEELHSQDHDEGYEDKAGEDSDDQQDGEKDDSH